MIPRELNLKIEVGYYVGLYLRFSFNLYSHGSVRPGVLHWKTALDCWPSTTCPAEVQCNWAVGNVPFEAG